MSDIASSRAPNRGLQFVVLGIGFALLVAVVLGCAWLVNEQAESNADVRRVLALQNRFEKALAVLQDAETGQRGFLITRDESYLAPYRGAQAAFNQELDAIENLIVRE